MDWENLGNIKGVYNSLAESLQFYASKYHVNIVGYVFMPSHIHLLLIIKGDLLSSFMRDFKKYISQKCMKDLNINQKQIWMPRYDRLTIYSEEVFRNKLGYIHKNPVRAGLCEEMKEWRWSSYNDYFGRGEGLIDIYKDWNF